MAFPFQRSFWVQFSVVAFLVVVFVFDLLMVSSSGGDSAKIASYVGLPESLRFDAQIEREPDLRSDRQRLVLRVQRLWNEKQVFRVDGLVLVTLPRYPEYHYGDSLLISGLLEDPLKQLQVSYGYFLVKEGIGAVVRLPRVLAWSYSRQGDAWSLLFWFKSRFSSTVKLLFDDPSSSIVQGLLLGIRTSIPDTIVSDFNATGLTHILAISGYNITLLITLCGMIFAGFGRRARSITTCLFIFFFAVATGLSASVVRASIMGLMMVMAGMFGRKSTGIQALLITAAIMAAVNPLILAYDVSFQLSFFSTLGIMLFERRFEVVFSALPKFIAQGLSVTLAAQLLTTPVILSSFGRFSLIAPVMNILFLPMIPSIMFCSFLAVVIGFLWPPAALLPVAASWFLIRVLLDGVHMGAVLPLASLNIPTFPWWMVVGWYGFFVILEIIFRKPRWARFSV